MLRITKTCKKRVTFLSTFINVYYFSLTLITSTFLWWWCWCLLHANANCQCINRQAVHHLISPSQIGLLKFIVEHRLDRRRWKMEIIHWLMRETCRPILLRRSCLANSRAVRDRREIFGAPEMKTADSRKDERFAAGADYWTELNICVDHRHSGHEWQAASWLVGGMVVAAMTLMNWIGSRRRRSVLSVQMPAGHTHASVQNYFSKCTRTDGRKGGGSSARGFGCLFDLRICGFILGSDDIASRTLAAASRPEQTGSSCPLWQVTIKSTVASHPNAAYNAAIPSRPHYRLHLIRPFVRLSDCTVIFRRSAEA